MGILLSFFIEVVVLVVFLWGMLSVAVGIAGSSFLAFVVFGVFLWEMLSAAVGIV